MACALCTGRALRHPLIALSTAASAVDLVKLLAVLTHVMIQDVLSDSGCGEVFHSQTYSTILEISPN